MQSSALIKAFGYAIVSGDVAQVKMETRMQGSRREDLDSDSYLR